MGICRSPLPSGWMTKIRPLAPKAIHLPSGDQLAAFAGEVPQAVSLRSPVPSVRTTKRAWLAEGRPGRVVADERDAAAAGRVVGWNVVHRRGRDSNEVACVGEVEGVEAVSFRMLVIEHLAGEAGGPGGPPPGAGTSGGGGTPGGGTRRGGQ